MLRYCLRSMPALPVSAMASPSDSITEASRKLPLSFTRLAACGVSDTTKVLFPIASKSGAAALTAAGAPAATMKSWPAAATSGRPSTSAHMPQTDKPDLHDNISRSRRYAGPPRPDAFITKPLLVAGDHCVERPRASTVENEGDGKPDGQHVVLESLARLVPVPVHEEVLPVNGEDRPQHDGGDAERRHSRQETQGEAQRPEKLGHDGQYGDG